MARIIPLHEPTPWFVSDVIKQSRFASVRSQRSGTHCRILETDTRHPRREIGRSTFIRSAFDWPYTIIPIQPVNVLSCLFGERQQWPQSHATATSMTNVLQALDVGYTVIINHLSDWGLISIWFVFLLSFDCVNSLSVASSAVHISVSDSELYEAWSEQYLLIILFYFRNSVNFLSSAYVLSCGTGSL